MADALTGVTEIDATAEEVVSARVQSVLTASMVAWPRFLDFSPEAGSGADTVKIPRFGNFTVNSKAENTRVDAQINAFSADNLLLNQHKVIQFLIEDIASVQSKVAVMDEYVSQAGQDMAADMDLVLFKELDDNVSTSAPDHDINYNDTTNDDLEIADIVEARRLLGVQNVPMGDRSCFVTPDKEADLLKIDNFVRLDASGSQGLTTGQIGRVYGFEVFMSTQMDAANSSLFCHRSAAATARQLLPKIEMDRDLPQLSDRWSVSHIYGVKTLDSGKRHVRLTPAP